MRAETISLRVDQKQRRWFVGAAEKEGVSVSEWLRRLGVIRAAELGTIAENDASAAGAVAA